MFSRTLKNRQIYNVSNSLIRTRKNGFAEASKNLAEYRFENNFVWAIKIIV